MINRVLQRNNVKVAGNEKGTETIMFAHGFGCDQNMWRKLVPHFSDDYKIVLFDLVGMGQSDNTAFDEEKYASLEGHVSDVVEICETLDLKDIIFVGHSVSTMIGTLAAVNHPEFFSHLIMVGPSPRYINDEDYIGGFSSDDIEELLDTLASNYLGWSSQMSSVIMKNADRPELAQELEESFCRNDPKIAEHFARVTFLGDNRHDLEQVKTPTLILQCSSDVIAPAEVGKYVHEHIKGSVFKQLNATGHCPHLSAPEETARAIKAFLNK